MTRSRALLNLFVAVLAMAATLPGRSVGLGLITEPISADLSLDRLDYAWQLFIASILGSGFALAIGPLFDRFGARWVMAATAGGLALAAFAVSGLTTGGIGLLLLLILLRGLGQTALAAESVALVGKSFTRRLPVAMAVYAATLSILLAVLIVSLGAAVEHRGWRGPWAVLALGVAGVALLSAVAVRTPPRATAASEPAVPGSDDPVSFTLRQALSTPVFWLFALGSSAFALYFAAYTIFNEQLLAGFGHGPEVSRAALGSLMLAGLVGNFICGALAGRVRLPWLMLAAVLLLAFSAGAYPLLGQPGVPLAQAGTLGLSAGFITALFFTAFPKAFGREHLGKIQGAAQLVTVLGTASGPVLLEQARRSFGGHEPFFYIMAGVFVAFAVWAGLTKRMSPPAPGP